MFESRFMPCPDCGGSVERSESPEHQCDPDRLMAYRVFGIREEIAAFERQLAGYIQTDAGRFEQWLAARQVRGD